MKFALLLLLAFSALANGQQSLKSLAENHKRYVGIALSPHQLEEADFAKTADREFDCVTPENQMKWGETEPTKGHFTFGEGDKIVNHAHQHGMKVRGHTLLWYLHLPNWMSESKFSEAELKTILHNHISSQAGHWKGKIYAWDVVNEVLNDNGTMRHSVFYPTLGKGFIADAFRWAHEADPDAKLYINDYHVEGVNAKSNALHDLVKELQAEKVPIHGVGLQSHFPVGHLPHDIKQNMERFASLGLDVAITELDIHLDLPATESQLQQQAKDYTAVFKACLEVPKCVGVTMWGMTDKYGSAAQAKQNKGDALLFDKNYKEKPAYKAVHEVLSAK